MGSYPTEACPGTPDTREGNQPHLDTQLTGLEGEEAGSVGLPHIGHLHTEERMRHHYSPEKDMSPNAF